MLEGQLVLPNYFADILLARARERRERKASKRSHDARFRMVAIMCSSCRPAAFTMVAAVLGS